MFTRDERRALVFLAAVAVAGGVIRAVRPGGESQAAAVAPLPPGDDLARQAALSRRAAALAQPLAPGERVDLDRAPADELERLPRVGRRLARRIVADRGTNGPFGSPEGLRRVSGMSPGLVRDLEPYATFGGTPAAVLRAASAAGPGAAAPAPAAPAPASAAGKAGRACAGSLSLNRATADELMCVPGIGRVLAERIVADRTRRGAFRDSADLARVPGLGRARIARLRGRLTIP